VSLHLLENHVTEPQTGRTGFNFQDITEYGFSKITPAWLNRVLAPALDAEETSNERQTLEESTADYELHHVS
jgi:hypothetical protein